MDNEKRVIIKKLRRDSDSFFTFIFARKISKRITPLLKNTPITPLQVTLTGLLIGLLGAWIGSIPIWYCGVIAAFLIETAHVLDCIDGELARITDRGNPFAACMDPITDRLKDIAVIYAAYIQSLNTEIFNLSEFQLSTLAIVAVGLWLIYIYIVDAYLNPAKKQIAPKSNKTHKRVYLGFYDLFVYGSITFWLLNKFCYFNVFILFLSITGITIQIIRLKKIFNRKNQ